MKSHHSRHRQVGAEDHSPSAGQGSETLVVQPHPSLAALAPAPSRQRLPGKLATAAHGAIRDLAVTAREHHEAFALALILCLALVVRALLVYREPFPLNDGGLFYAMARDLQDTHFVLPSHTSYNDGEIPFAYSPLSIYLAALGDTLTPASLEDMFRMLPLLGGVFAVWAFWRLGVAILPSRNAALVATLLFALVPRSFIWLIMGGGLPRGLALGVALLAIREGLLLAREPFSRRRLFSLAVLSALLALTHLETAVFVALTFALLIAFRPRSFPRFVAAGLGALALSGPWLGALIARHGFAPFFASSDYSGNALNAELFDMERILFLVRNPVFTDEQFFPLIGALGVVGAFYALARREWLLPAWWTLILVVGLRAGPTYAAVPIAMLGGSAIVHGFAATLAASGRDAAEPGGRWAMAIAGGLALVFLVQGALEHSRYDARFLRSMPEGDLAALEWIQAEVPAGERFAVMPVESWYADYASEWFPALTGHTSVGTPQGYEWVEGSFEARLAIHDSLRMCMGDGADCVASVMRRAGASYLFVPSACCDVLGNTVARSSAFEVVYFHDRALVARLRGAATADPPLLRP
jgi:hypothetical protein